MTTFETEQESFWNGEFGDQYVARNTAGVYLASNIALFSKILSRTTGVKSVIEFGCNVGLNLQAIRHLSDTVRLRGVEINHSAAEQLRAWGQAEVFESSIVAYQDRDTFDLSLIKGVLIHISPDHLDQVYQQLYACTTRYVCVCEYYNPTPVSVPYRGHADRLFKRDFAGELLDQYPDLRLVDYGFCYHRDNNYPQDDLTWFLLEKVPSGRDA